MTALTQPLPWRTLLHRYLANHQRMAMSTQQYGAGQGPLAVDGARVYQARQGGGVNTIVNCTFTAANGTLLTAYPWTDPADVRLGVNQWTNNAGAGGVTSSRATSTTNLNVDSTLNCGVSDCTITATLRIGGATAYSRLAFRATNTTNLWICGINGNTQLLDMFEITAGVVTLRASAALAIAINTDYAIALVLSGTSIAATIGAANITYSSAVRQAAQLHGIYVSRNGIGGGFVDNFQVTTP